MFTGKAPLNTMNRRSFAGSGLAALASLLTIRSSAQGRKFYTAFVPGSLGVKADQAKAIELAAKYGYDSVQPFPQDLRRDGAQRYLEALEQNQLRWAAAGLPVNFRSDDDAFAKDMAELPAIADVLKEAAVARVGTWLSPAHETLTYLQNFKRTAKRLGEVAKVLSDRGIRLGLEYVGTKRNWTGSRHSFVHTMAGTKELIDEIRRPNVGVVLDSWHWWTSLETADDIRTLSNDDVVSADLNDAPSGIEREDQYDNRRELPMATGVINVRDFLEALVSIGYDGPIRAEPFNQRLNEMEDEQASRVASESLRKAFALVG